MADGKDDTLPRAEKNEQSTPASIAKPTTVDDDSDPDFDDLDDVLDQFSSAHEQSQFQPNVQPPRPAPSASGPGRPSSPGTLAVGLPSLAPQPAESEDDFMARLTSEMSSVLGNLDPNPSASKASDVDISNLGAELDEFTSAMEKQGVNPEDLLKAILGDAATIPGTAQAATSGTTNSKPPSQTSTTKPAKPDSTSGEKESFEETIRRTMQRMQASDSHATNASTDPPNSNTEGDMLASLLKAMEPSSGSGADPNAPLDSEDTLSKMFLGMMEQLTNKDMLYEPMKELDAKYPDWLNTNKAKLSEEDYRRYEAQRGVVREIVGKFEEKGYSDEEAGCREFVWERMQRMQGLGSPPEDLIANPFPEMGSGIGGAGERRGKEDDVGCPTQ